MLPSAYVRGVFVALMLLTSACSTDSTVEPVDETDDDAQGEEEEDKPDARVRPSVDASVPAPKPDASAKPDAAAKDASLPVVKDASLPMQDASTPPAPNPLTPGDRTPDPKNIPECPKVAPENPIGSCIGVPVYAVCGYTTYTCICDWYHWLCL
jgi:hypothetical protein